MADLLIDVGPMDWPLLRSQKRWLVEQAAYSEEAEGLLNLIDRIQDQAVDVCGVPEDEVFERTDVT